MLDKLFIMGQMPVTQTLRFIDANTRSVLTSTQLQSAKGGIISLAMVDTDVQKDCTSVLINYDQLLNTMCQVSELQGRVVDCPQYVAGIDPKSYCSQVLVNLNLACNHIAGETRRAAGNNVFLDQASYDFLTQCTPWSIHLNLIVDPTMPAGHALVAYKNPKSNEDGGYIAFHDTITNQVEVCFTGTVEQSYYYVVKFDVPSDITEDDARTVQLNWRK